MNKKYMKYIVLFLTVLLLVLIIVLANGNNLINYSYFEIELAILILVGLLPIIITIDNLATIIRLGLGKTRKELKTSKNKEIIIDIISELILIIMFITINLLIYNDVMMANKLMIIILTSTSILSLIISLIISKIIELNSKF